MDSESCEKDSIKPHLCIHTAASPLKSLSLQTPTKSDPHQGKKLILSTSPECLQNVVVSVPLSLLDTSSNWRLNPKHKSMNNDSKQFSVTAVGSTTKVESKFPEQKQIFHTVSEKTPLVKANKPKTNITHRSVVALDVTAPKHLPSTSVEPACTSLMKCNVCEASSTVISHPVRRALLPTPRMQTPLSRPLNKFVPCTVKNMESSFHQVLLLAAHIQFHGDSIDKHMLNFCFELFFSTLVVECFCLIFITFLDVKYVKNIKLNYQRI